MNKRVVKALSDFEHVIKRPTMYVGQIAKIDTKIPFIDKSNYVLKKDALISPAFYKLFDEVLGNAFDEAIRMNGKLKEISISFDTKTNEVIVSDSGSGFYKGTEINPKTNRTNIETAFTQLKAGTNFDDDREEKVIGTNGVGVSLVNMLSEEFEIITKNNDYIYEQKWTHDDWLKEKLAISQG
jgi:DNA gyrase/topoisomerase IV subunit B